jgi:hypothetical protein
MLLIVTASPAFRSYPGWVVASQQIDTVLSGTLKLIQSAPENIGFVFINIPGHYRENNTDFLVTKSAAILWPYSLTEWFALQDVKNKAVILGSSDHMGSIRTPEIELVDSSKLKIYFTSPDSYYYYPEYTWPPPELGTDQFRVYVYDGSQFIENQWLETNTQALTKP